MKRKWSEFTRTQRSLIVVGSAVELVLTAVAVVDLIRRPSEDVRGPKPLWFGVLLIQPIGPIAYLIAGRRPQEIVWDFDLGDLGELQ